MSRTATYGVPTLALPNAAANRRNLFVVAFPVVLFVGICLASLAQHLTQPATMGGSLSDKEAATIAGDFITRLTGAKSSVVSTSFQEVYSLRRKTTFREWEAICQSSRERYLVRINADTRAVYAINRLTNENEPDSESYLPKPQAEQLARKYLTTMGLSLHSLQKVSQADSPDSDSLHPGGNNEWNFCYRRKGQKPGTQQVSVTLDSRTGDVDHLWSPPSSL